MAITDLNGELLASLHVPTEIWRGKSGFLQRCFSAVRETLNSAGMDAHSIIGTGIAFSGVIDTENGVVLSYPRPGQVEEWRNVPLRKLAEDEFGVPCIIEDSVRAVATTERQIGLGRNLSNFVYIDVGMGAGAAIYIDGRIYRGCNGSGGEFGHVKVEENGPLCQCGGSGCLEAVASCASIIESVRTAIGKGVSSRIAEMAANNLDQITIEMIAKAAEENDSLAYRSLCEAAVFIGAASADVVNLLNPEALIFGGALFRAAGDTIIEHIRHQVRHRAMEKSLNDVTFFLSKQDSGAGAKGIASLIAARLIEPLYHANSKQKANHHLASRNCLAQY